MRFKNKITSNGVIALSSFTALFAHQVFASGPRTLSSYQKHRREKCMYIVFLPRYVYVWLKAEKHMH